MLEKFAEIKLFKYLQDILDALGSGTGGGGGSLPVENTQLTTSYYEALTTKSEWIIGDTLKRVQVLDITVPEIPILISTTWVNERTQTELTTIPTIGTVAPSDCKQIGSSTATTTATGLATQATLYNVLQTLRDDVYTVNLTGTDTAIIATRNKNSVVISTNGTGTFNSAPVVKVFLANSTWVDLATIDPNFTVPTTATNQFIKLNCAGYDLIKFDYAVTGVIEFKAVVSTKLDTQLQNTLLAEIATNTANSGGGGGDASAANQVIQNTLLTDIANYTASSSLVNAYGSHIFTTGGQVDIDVTDYATLTLSRQSTNGDAEFGGIFTSNNDGATFGYVENYMAFSTDSSNFLTVDDGGQLTLNVAGLTTIRLYLASLHTSTSCTVDWVLSKLPTPALRNIEYILAQVIHTKLDEMKVRQSLGKVTGQTINISGTTAQSVAVASETTRVVLTSTVNTWVEIGANPTATIGGTSTYLAAGVPSYPIDVIGGTTKIAAIADSASGKLSIFESR